jgi:hypothetical protein
MAVAPDPALRLPRLEPRKTSDIADVGAGSNCKEQFCMV